MQWSALAALPSFFHLKAVEYEIWATAKTEEDQRREWCNKSEISATGLHLDVVRTATRDSDSTFTPDFEPRARLHALPQIVIIVLFNLCECSAVG